MTHTLNGDRGIIGYGTYVPYWRLPRAAVGAALGLPAGSGTRAVAAHDEDALSMGVEAARRALRSTGDASIAQVLFATTAPPYADKTAATALHAALDLDPSAAAYDLNGATRCGVGTLRFAATSPDTSLAVLSEVRTGLPGSADESAGGDAAAAFVFGQGRPLATLIGKAAATDEFLDRWRVPGDAHSSQWEERFAEGIYLQLAEQAIADACKAAGVTPGDIDHLLVAGLHARAVRRFIGASGVRPEVVADDLRETIGNTGIAHVGLVLAEVLDRAGPNEVIVAAVLADGCDVLVFQTTDAIADWHAKSDRAGRLRRGGGELSYPTFLSWRGMLRREPPRRPDPAAPAAPPAHRNARWKFSFTGSQCRACSTRHLPPERVCLRCGTVDAMEPAAMADVPGTVTTFTIDRLAYSQSPPSVAAVIDFDGGGRFQCEMTDVDAAEVAIGMRVEMTFRRMYAAGGVHNYFWKARPIEKEI